MNEYLEELIESKNKKSYAHTLVGQINQHKKSQQLLMDHNDEKVVEFTNMLCGLGAEYINHFSKATGATYKTNKRVEMDELWSVHSYERDYNPIHSHGTKTMMGISCTTWTKVPKQILEQPTSGTPEYSLYNDSGHSDGCLAFNYGKNSLLDSERLFPPQSCVIKPEIGMQYMFPSGLQHMVYPFFGEGERRTVAANLNCFDVVEKS